MVKGFERRAPWKTVALKECCRAPLSYGVNAPSVPYSFGLPSYIRITDITEDGRYNKNQKVSVACDNAEKYMLSSGDIVLARTGASVGKSYLFQPDDGDLVFAGFLIKAPIDSEIADARYVHACLQTNEYWQWVRYMSQRSGQPGINSKEYACYRFSLPPKKEQEAIAEALSDIDALISSLERLIEKKKEVRKGAEQYLFSGVNIQTEQENAYAYKTVGEMGVFYGGLSGKTKGDFGTGNARYIPFLNVLTNSIINPSNLDIVHIDNGEKQNVVHRGDLFFNTSSETPEEVGMCAVLLDNLPNTYLNSFCFGYRLNNEGILPLYLSYYFNSGHGRLIMRLLAQGSTRYNLSKSSFSKVKLAIPDMQIQTTTVSTLSEIDQELARLEQKLAKYKQIKQGMMHELLTGSIRLVRE